MRGDCRINLKEGMVNDKEDFINVIWDRRNFRGYVG